MLHKEMSKRIEIKLGKLLDEKGISQREFSRLTGLRQATVNELCNNRRMRISLDHLTLILQYFEIEDINQVLEVKENDDVVESK